MECHKSFARLNLDAWSDFWVKILWLPESIGFCNVLQHL